MPITTTITATSLEDLRNQIVSWLLLQAKAKNELTRTTDQRKLTEHFFAQGSALLEAAHLLEATVIIEKI